MKPVEAMALISGNVEEEVPLRNEYLALENAILRSKLGRRVELTDGEHARLAVLAEKLGGKALKGLSAIVQPETLLSWFRHLVAGKYDSSKRHKAAGRPPIASEVESLMFPSVA